MKISKVNHAKSSVGQLYDKSSGGIIYQCPGKGNMNLRNRLSTLDRAYKLLYNVLIPVQAGTEPKDKDNEVKMNNYLRRRKFEELEKEKPNLNKNVLGILFKDKKNNVFNSDNAIIEKTKSAAPLKDVTAEEICAIALRGSLKKSKSELECAQAFFDNLGKRNISDDDRKKILQFVDIVKNDYNKLDLKNDKSEGKAIIRSIENQNMVIQPNKSNKLMISDVKSEGKATSHKQDEIDGFNSFLENYADLDKDSRMDILRKLNRLVDLFFSEPGQTDSIDFCKDEEDVFTHHVEQKKCEDNFVEIPDAFLKNDKKEKLDSVVAKKAIEELNNNIRRKYIVSYRNSIEVTNNDAGNLFFDDQKINKYWIHHIENAVERMLKNCDQYNLYKLNVGYLKNKIWKDLINTISVKYIAIGKAVFNFAMDDLYKEEGDINLGVINKKVADDNITSFDYEMIKARETLQRKIAVNVVSSTNNLARATVSFAGLDDKDSDFLLWNSPSIIDGRLINKTEGKTVDAILQYFGGKSQCGNIPQVIGEEYACNKYTYDAAFLFDLKKILYAMRNESFHFTTATINTGDWKTELTGKMFAMEAEVCASLDKDKFYSNNLPKFYSQNDLEKILNGLYERNVSRASQVPSFNKVVVRTHFPTFIKEKLGANLDNRFDTDTMDEWQHALYYVCKEIYYNAFLNDEKAKEMFLNAVRELDETDDETKMAVTDYKRRVFELKGSLSEICQYIMTEYNAQNNQRKVRKDNNNLFDKEIFQHYRVLLYKSLADAFGKYLKNNFAVLLNPRYGSAAVLPAKEDFLCDWSSPRYKKLIEKINKDAQLQKWYIMSKFLSPRDINLLLGDMRSFLQYVGDVRKRAKQTNNKLHVDIESSVQMITRAIPVVELCLKTSANVSADYKDYFADTDEYAKYLSKFVDYKGDTFDALLEFCNSDESKNDLYTDAKNPKLNRNIVFAKLYGPDQILDKVLDNITKAEIREFYVNQKDILDYKLTGSCDSQENQEKLIAYQKLKNRVELRNVAEYGEIINELLGMLVNWSFLRERDLLYYQLGFHYSCLMNNTDKPDAYKVIESDTRTISGAILYQIAGLYINGIGIWSYSDSESEQLKETSVNGGVGGKVKAFNKYAASLKPEFENGFLYDAGLEIFENVNEHDSIVRLRNYIDHFKYYMESPEKETKTSLLDLYSEIFDRFFSYDVKYRKNTVNMLNNMLLRHFYAIEPRFAKGDKLMDSGSKKDAVQIDVNTISTTELNYNLDDENVLIMPARNKKEVETLLRILYYPNLVPDNVKFEIPSSRIKEKPIKNTNNNNKQNNKGKKDRTKGKSQEIVTESLSYNPFANFKLN